MRHIPAATPKTGSGFFIPIRKNLSVFLPDYWIGVEEYLDRQFFHPSIFVTRQEFSQMLYNYAAYKDYDLTAQGDLAAFPDGDSVQEWALPAMAWANGNSLINGHDDGTLEPAGTTTRAQAASILMRFDQNVVEE